MILILSAIAASGQVKDWAQTDRYANKNAELKAGNTKPEVIIFGDSIISGWYNQDEAFFTGNGFVGRGIGGQTTCQALIRMRPDVIDLHPKIVVILIGVNDIAQNIGPVSKETSLGNIISMCELARVNKIKPVLCSILPAYNFRWRPELTPAEDVRQFNEMLKEYARKAHIRYVDFYSSLVDERGGIDSKYSEETVHPNLEGYKIMESILMDSIAGMIR